MKQRKKIAAIRRAWARTHDEGGSVNTFPSLFQSERKTSVAKSRRERGKNEKKSCRVPHEDSRIRSCTSYRDGDRCGTHETVRQERRETQKEETDRAERREEREKICKSTAGDPESERPPCYPLLARPSETSTKARYKTYINDGKSSRSEVRKKREKVWEENKKKKTKKKMSQSWQTNLSLHHHQR